ncbi:hypothetical protein [Alienimonas chondri]|uniref:Uncharacterized protein n=1 Tax=Alienimonas chondri TaxID=2681879 RepID=A0ABX1VBL4_9PLAN|nr:hypothetical protein [Alienimonas chondri]NNJ25331.1 hypothetical protein [Alienimonas chondri]
MNVDADAAPIVPMDGAVHATLDGFLLENLDRICADRPLITDALHQPNDFYGQAPTLRRYASLPETPLPIALEHGLRFDQGAWENDLEAPLAVLGVASETRAATVRRLLPPKSRKRVEAIGFGSLYAAALVRETLGPDPAPADRTGGTLAFPSHSTHHIRAVLPAERLAEGWASLPAALQPVVVCLYWKDVLHGQAAPYRAAGLPVVSVGHMFSPEFLLRLHALCRHFRFATANGIGTHLFAASGAGCRFFFTPKVPERYSAPAERLSDMGSADRTHDVARALFGERPPIGPDADAGRDAERAAFVGGYLGKSSFRTPEEFRDLVRHAERRRRYHAACTATFGWPRRLTRAAKRFAARLGPVRG